MGYEGRKAFSLYEAAILLEQLLQIKNGGKTRKEAVKQVSHDLRQMERNQGNFVVDSFRNETGINYQMKGLEVVYYGDDSNRQSSKLFYQIVDLYRTDNVKFEEILGEAKSMVENQKEQEKSIINNQDRQSEEDKLIEFLGKQKLKYMDTREQGGALWILGGKELAKVLGFCKAMFRVQFNYKAEGTKETNYISAWWTKSKTSSGVKNVNKKEQEEKVQNEITQEQLEIQEKNLIGAIIQKKLFLEWLKIQNLSEKTANMYYSNINSIQNFAESNGLSSTQLYGVSKDEAVVTINELKQCESFIEYNKNQHNRFSAALNKFQEYIGMVSIQSQQVDIDLAPYKRVLSEKFKKGYRPDSFIDLKNFKRHWLEVHGEENTESDKVIGKAIATSCILYDKKMYEVESMLRLDTQAKLLSYLRSGFDEGKSAIYYKAIFDEFSNAFLEETIYNTDMLKAYLSHVFAGQFYFKRSYIALDSTATVDSVEEIRSCLIEVNTPITYDELLSMLPHITLTKIKQILAANDEFIGDGKERYFHISGLNIDDEDLEKISQIITFLIEKNGFVSGNELYNAIASKYPHIIEENSQVSMHGLRNGLAYLLKSRFSFNSNIISAFGEELSMEKVFADYCSEKTRFSLDELKTIKKELDTNIYFNAVYENSLRISQTEFVSKNQACFDQQQIDKAIALFCTEAYIAISKIDQFALFPDVGFAWNSYLLEHYVAMYSEEYKLIHKQYNESSCVGAIVRKSSKIDSLEELIIDVLAKSNIELKRDIVLDYLCDEGYLARRSYSAIEQVLIKAIELRNQRGN